MTHGMVLLIVPDGVLTTCLCGWFSAEMNAKVDMAAAAWREHMMERLDT
jgi:hypothetical protein